MIQANEVKVQVKGFYKSDRNVTLSGVAAKWVAWIVDMQEFLNDPRNRGVIEFNFNGAQGEIVPRANLTPQP